MGEIGFSVVGLGMGASRARLITETEGARLVSVVDLREDLAEKMGREFGCRWQTDLDDALNDDEVDVMFILTPSGTHCDLVVRVLDAGKHAISTKPMEVTVDRCDLMLEAQQRSGKLLCIDFERRFEDVHSKAKWAIENGRLGRLMMGEARLKWFRDQEYYDAGGWRGTWKMDGGGALANQTIHEIDLLRWLMGPPRTVTGRIAALNHKIETEDLGVAIIEFESGAVGTILGTTTFPVSDYQGLEVHGTEGAMISTGEEPRWIFSPGLEDRAESIERFAPYENTIQNMVAAVRDGAPLICDGHEGRASVQILNAVYESARDGSKPVKLG
ncbi:MAG: hypothetical protein CMJ18_00615 [Phycisphaeraceae bacterium]|nr:hypothetical protein [Phycisphaeraceae bacterium]